MGVYSLQEKQCIFQKKKNDGYILDLLNSLFNQKHKFSTLAK